MALKDFLSESLEKIKDSLKEPEGVDVVLLEKASESAPEYIREIIKNREITIPHSIIEAQLKEQVKEVKSTKVSKNPILKVKAFNIVSLNTS